MATKNELVDDISFFYRQYQKHFERAGIDSINFFNWLELQELAGHQALQKATSFCFKGDEALLLKVNFARYLYDKVSEYMNYDLMAKISPKQKDVHTVKEAYLEVKACWKNRPKDKRKRKG